MKKPTPSLQEHVPASDRGHSWNKGPLGPALIWEHVRRGPYFGNAPIPGQYPTQNLTDVVEVSVSKYPLGSGCGIWVIFYIPYLHSRFGLKLYYFSSVKILIIEKFFKFLFGRKMKHLPEYFMCQRVIASPNQNYWFLGISTTYFPLFERQVLPVCKCSNVRASIQLGGLDPLVAILVSKNWIGIRSDF